MATEVAIFPLKESLGDTLNTDAGKIFQETLDTVLAQPGCQRAYWGIEHENPGTGRLFIDWDSVDAHKQFMNSDIYKPFGEKFGKVVDLSNTQLYHAHLHPHPPSEVLSRKTSPATEILVIHFPASYSQADKDKFDGDFQKLLSIVKDVAGTCTAGAGGWIVEEQEAEGEKTIAYAGFIGWDSVEAHLDFRGTTEFKENIHLLRGAKELKKLAVVHYHGNLVEGK